MSFRSARQVSFFAACKRERLGAERADHMEIAIAAQHAGIDDAAVGQRRLGDVAEQPGNAEDEIVGKALGREARDDESRVRAAALQQLHLRRQQAAARAVGMERDLDRVGRVAHHRFGKGLQPGGEGRRMRRRVKSDVEFGGRHFACHLSSEVSTMLIR